MKTVVETIKGVECYAQITEDHDIGVYIVQIFTDGRGWLPQLDMDDYNLDAARGYAQRTLHALVD